MATMRKVITRLASQQPSPNILRWSSTATETATSVTRVRTEKNLLFDKVNQKDSEASITEILNEYQNEGNAVKRFDIVSLSNYFRIRKNYQSAVQLYDWAESNKMELTNADKAIRINGLYKTKDLASAEKYFNGLQESEKTNKTYGALLSCYCRERALDKALEIFKKMTALNFIAVLNYNNLLALYYSIEQPEKVVSLVQEMKEKKQIVPDLYTYNLLMNSYAAMKNIDAVEEILEEMKSKNVKLDLFTYGNLATIYVNSGLHLKAKTYLEMMEKFENQPKKEFVEASYTRITLYSEMSDLSGVNRAWESLKSIFPTTNNTSYLIMLLALSKLGELERLETLHKEWEEQSRGSYDFRLPNVLLEYYINANMIEKATALYESLICRGTEPNARALNSFTTLCIKSRQMDLALKYLEMGVNKAVSENCAWFPTDETVKLFLDYFEETNDEDRVEKFIQSMKKVDRLDSTVYDSLLSNAKASTQER